MPTNFIKNLMTILPYIVLLIGASAIVGCIYLWGSADAEKANRIKALEADKTALTTQVIDLKKSAQASQEIGAARVESAERIRTITKEITREVPTLLPAAGAAALLLPAGWGLLHDAAATGTPSLLDPASPRRADETPIPAADAASTVIANYGSCRDTSDRLTHLQDWACTVAPDSASYCSPSDSGSSFSGGDL